MCGRELCCSSWLREFQAVSVKMVKAQGLSLNPSKLAGQCGRLKCCMRYEYQTYVELKRDAARDRHDVESVEGQRQGDRAEHPQADGARCVRDDDGERVEATLDDLVVQRRPMPDAVRSTSRRRSSTSNAEPHLGHTYTTVVADMLARFWRARGRDVFVVTGTDEHGDKIAQAAAKRGRRPEGASSIA